MSNRLRCLDGVRALAALSVLVYHSWSYATGSGNNWSGLTDTAFERMRWGLTVFFVLSGFLLYRPFVRASREGTTPDLLRYARHRVARILPAYLAVVAIVVALSSRVRAPADLLRNVFLVHGFTVPADRFVVQPTWSLCIEAQFYVTVPLLGLYAAQRFSRHPGLYVAVLAVIGVGLHYASRGHHSYLTLLGYLIEFVPGMALAVAYEKGTRVRPGLAFALAAAIVAFCVQWPDYPPASLATEPLIACATAILLAGVLIGGRDTLPGRILASRPLAALGTISYGIFLWHSPIINALDLNAGPRGYLATADVATLTIIGSIAAATLSWFLLEKPILARAHRRAEHRFATVPAAGG